MMRVIVIGGVAAGPKAAAKVMRLRPDADVTVIEKGEFLSYAGCGLPYYISGVVREQAELMSTPIGVVRDAEYFRSCKGITVLNRTEATKIDRRSGRVEVKDLSSGRTRWLEYDKLVLATGARPVVPPIPGKELRNVFVVHRVEDAEAIRSAIAGTGTRNVVIVGGGLIGIETAEALHRRGVHVAIVEMLPQVLPMLDWELARQVEKHLTEKGVSVLTDSKVLALEPGQPGGTTVGCVRTERETLPADLVILAIGVRPNIQLAETADLEIGPTGAIRVDAHMRTSDPDIYAAGDCVESTNLVTGKPCFVPLGSTANKQGRVAAMNICGGNDVFPGVIGSTVCKVFDHTVARTGAGEEEARAAGFDVVTCLNPAPDKAHYYPLAKPLMLKLIADRKTRRLLGAQATGPGEGSKRIDVAATAITAGLTVDQVAKLDLAYAPPFSPAMDNLIVAADILRNKMDDQLQSLTPMQVKRMLEAGEEVFLLDARSPAEYEQGRIEQATLIPLGALRARADEVPRDTPVVAFCKSSLRAYEAARILHGRGYTNVKVMDGGIVMWPYELVD